MRYIMQLSLILPLILMFGCATPITPRYSVSAKNVVELRDLYGKSPNKIKVTEITSDIKDEYAMQCRGAEIQVPDGLSVAEFVKRSFADELKLAGVYSEKGNIEFRAKVTKLDVECNFGTAKWITEIEISMGSKHTFTVSNIHSFEGAVYGDTVFKSAQSSLTPALQDLFWKIIKQPNFHDALSTHN